MNFILSQLRNDFAARLVHLPAFRLVKQPTSCNDITPPKPSPLGVVKSSFTVNATREGGYDTRILTNTLEVQNPSTNGILLRIIFSFNFILTNQGNLMILLQGDRAQLSYAYNNNFSGTGEAVNMFEAWNVETEYTFPAYALNSCNSNGNNNEVYIYFNNEGRGRVYKENGTWYYDLPMINAFIDYPNQLNNEYTFNTALTPNRITLF